MRNKEAILEVIVQGERDNRRNRAESLQRESEKSDPAESIELRLMHEVQEQIDSHRKASSQQSYLQRAVSSVYSPSAQTLHELVLVQEELERDHDHKLAVDPRRAREIEEKIQDDKKVQQHELKVSSITAGVLTAAPLFMPGPIGWAGSAALSALNTASPLSDLQSQAADAALGAGKGLALKGVFAASALLPGGFLTRTAFLSPAQRGIDSTLSRQTYLKDGSGRIDIIGGLQKVAGTTLNPYSLSADLGGQLLSLGSMIGLNYLSRGAIGRYPLLGTMGTGALYGFNSSISNDVKEHIEKGSDLTVPGVLGRGVESALLGAVSAAPAGLMQVHRAKLRSARIKEAQQHAPVAGDQRRILSGPEFGQREYVLHLPEGYAGEKLPVAVVLHGTGGSAREIQTKSNMNSLADMNKFIVAYPEGNNFLGDPNTRIWNIPARGLSVRGGQRQDTAFVAAVIDDVQRKINGITETSAYSRTHIGGMSAGGALAGIVAKMHPEKVNSVTIVSGVHLGDAMLPANKSVLVVHGARDPVIRSQGGLLSSFLGAVPVSSTFDRLVEQNSLSRIRTGSLGSINFRQAKGGDVHISEYLVDKPGAGHVWDLLRGGNEQKHRIWPEVSRSVVKLLQAH